jgi:hypothetical protein
MRRHEREFSMPLSTCAVEVGTDQSSADERDGDDRVTCIYILHMFAMRYVPWHTSFPRERKA